MEVKKIDITGIDKKDYIILLVITIISIILFFFLYILINDFNGLTIYRLKIKYSLISIAIYFLSIIFLGFMHEITHAIALIYFGKGKRKFIKFGIIWKALTPYVHYTKGINIKAYIISGIIPIIYGVVPIIIGLITNSLLIYIIGVTMFLGSYGDLLIVWMLKDIPKNAIVKDHPEKIGCEVFIKCKV